MTDAVECELNEGIGIVKLNDTSSHNTFSSEVIQGITDIFSALNAIKELKCVVIYGYDNYFCCGATKDELFAIHQRQMTCVDSPFYRILLDCPVPTIAAMQGHALGGGLAFGAYADIILLAEESIYSANFMKYGFTPGVGATYIIPRKFGETIGQELLYTAATYNGDALRKKGVPLTVIKRKDVIATAMRIARDIADKPRMSLELLKNHLTSEIKERLPKIIDEELRMHSITFTEPEVKKRIEDLFGS